MTFLFSLLLFPSIVVANVSISKRVVEYNYLSIIGIVLLVVAIIALLIKRKVDKSKCPYCKLKITSNMDICPRCGNLLK